MRVELISHTPDPDAICARAARSCRMPSVPESADKRVLANALSLGHDSVAEHASFTFAVQGISRACSHQLVRHRLASYAQQSQRAVAPSGTVVPHMESQEALAIYGQSVRASYEAYGKLIRLGVPKEDARYVLPEGTETSVVVTMNGRELRHFTDLRTAKDAQWEIRELAGKMRALAQEVAPTLINTARR